METGFYSVGVYGSVEGRAFDPDDLDRFEEALRGAAGVGGLPSDPALLGGEELGLRVSVEAGGAVEAALAVADLYRRACREAFGAELVPEIDEVGAVGQEKFFERERREEALARSYKEGLKLAGLKEVAEILNISRTRVGQLEDERASGRRGDFPSPVDRPAAGPMWDRGEIEAFDKAWRRHKTGRRRQARVDGAGPGSGDR